MNHFDCRKQLSEGNLGKRDWYRYRYCEYYSDGGDGTMNV